MIWHLARLLVLDTKHAVRQFVRYPVFTIVVVFSLVIGIGSTTAVFTVFNVALLQPLSGPEPHRRVVLSAERRGDRLRDLQSRVRVAAR